ncbi:MAG: glycosyltransferase [Actinobacteria bacterium]|nr:glycosyltransferase [Propionicimonas sp.]MBU3978022.1 glycosyltransferase [Actinomycetota bacterium]MBU3985466.1 glycosyltransferase [Actinomycetota bacterium]MBU4007561.1 glycosyltransferase [Actinomycetota bacterium]MBU4066545.1 glycosyltransferase [Actinomycetota bacterium]
MTLVLGFNYIGWRWLASVNWANWWIAVPLVLAETYSIIDLTLFSITIWRSRQREDAPPPPLDSDVDVFITTYNEPVELVVETVRAAIKIDHPHRTWVLDDGAREDLRQAAETLGAGYITRGDEWHGKPRHAKAGNLNNALLQTQGEYILVLDADMVAHPAILDRTLGFFSDEKVGLVQTPQHFINVPPSDPLGSQAPLFYGPIQEGKDGWGAAFFCGSNAVLRREALMEIGITGYVDATQRTVINRLKEARVLVRHSLRGADPSAQEILVQTRNAIDHALAEISRAEPIAEVTYVLHRKLSQLSHATVGDDMAQLADDLDALGFDQAAFNIDSEEVISRLAALDLSPLNAVEAVDRTLQAIDIGRSDEAQAVLPMATISVTEDMATSMRMHARGWKSVFHNEILAEGLAPEGLAASLTQRLRWAQGTMQVFLRENPLTLRGLTLPQRLMYFSTMWSYLSGFATVVYLLAPILFLTAGVLPVSSYAEQFFLRFIPFMVANQLLFVFASRGLPTWRGQQYTLALFPVWIKACYTAAANVWAGRPLGFAVTPKAGTRQTQIPWGLIGWQLAASIALVISIVVGTIWLVTGHAEPIGTLINLAWVVFDLVSMSALVGAVRYRGYHADEETR